MERCDSKSRWKDLKGRRATSQLKYKEKGKRCVNYIYIYLHLVVLWGATGSGEWSYVVAFSYLANTAAYEVGVLATFFLTDVETEASRR